MIVYKCTVVVAKMFDQMPYIGLLVTIPVKFYNIIA